MIDNWTLLVIGRQDVWVKNAIPECRCSVATAQTHAPTDVNSVRWHTLDVLASLLYTGSKWWHVVHLSNAIYVCDTFLLSSAAPRWAVTWCHRRLTAGKWTLNRYWIRLSFELVALTTLTLNYGSLFGCHVIPCNTFIFVPFFPLLQASCYSSEDSLTMPESARWPTPCPPCPALESSSSTELKNTVSIIFF